MEIERCLICKKASIVPVKQGWKCTDCRLTERAPSESNSEKASQMPITEKQNTVPTVQATYPNLDAYIFLLNILASPLALIATLAGFGMVFASASMGWPTLVSIIAAVISVVIGFIVYATLMAGIDFIRVMLAIENSTRQTAEILLSKSKRS